MSDPEVDKCVNVLKNAKTDNERFAALLLVTKAVKIEACEEEARKHLFEAIGFKFMKRLLQTENVPEGCSPYSFKSLALAVLSSFCSSSEITDSKNMVECIPYFNEIIIVDSSCAEEESIRAMVDDCYTCLTCLSRQNAGRLALIKHRTVTALTAAFTQKCLNCEKAEALLLALVGSMSEEVWNYNTEALNQLLPHYCSLMVSQQDQQKFDTCRKLCLLLSSMNQNQMEATQGKWLNDSKKELCRLLQSKISAEQRQPVLQIFSHLIDLNGTAWLLGDNEEDLEANKKYLLILVHLTCAEIRLTLEDHTFEEIIKCEDILSAGYGLLENVISFLTVGPQLGLESRQVSQLHTALMGAFNSIIYFLTQVRELHPELKLQSVVLATVRALGAWIAEETTALKTDVIKILPFLLEISGATLEMGRDELSRGMQELSLASEAAQSIPDVLQFLLPGLCHLSVEEEARRILLENNGHELLARYFSLQWQRWSSNHGHRDAHVALVAVCGIFLNLIVLERELVVQHMAFCELLSFLVTTVPVIESDQEHAVLAFNMMTVGLMLLRLHVEKNTNVVTGSIIERFLESCIRLLKGVHCIKEEGKTQMLAVRDELCEQWDLMLDLWALSMQVLTQLINEVPSMQGKIMKSGWIPAIAKLLTETRGSYSIEDPVVAAFCDLLSTMAVENQDAKKILVDRELIHLCSKT